jgi:hypothetical protein
MSATSGSFVMSKGGSGGAVGYETLYNTPPIRFKLRQGQLAIIGWTGDGSGNVVPRVSVRPVGPSYQGAHGEWMLIGSGMGWFRESEAPDGVDYEYEVDFEAPGKGWTRVPWVIVCNLGFAQSGGGS